jgi:REP element-mobilizing transposase RayT
MNRGRRAESIFSDEEDYKRFTELLKETSEMWNIRIAAYCLMPNHYHMLIQTPEANLSRSMRHLNGVYTQRYNSRHKCDGQLFRGRFKSILIDTDSYLLQAVRYIHRNPLNASLVQHIDDYKWSSHKGYLSVAQKWDWIHKNHILALISKNRKNLLRYYKKWVAVEDEGEVGQAIAGSKWPVSLGPKSFVDRIKEKYGAGKIHREIPSSREMAPDVDLIVETVCGYYGAAGSQVFKSRRGQTNQVRDVAIYLTRILRRETLKEVGSRFQIANERTVRSAVARIRAKRLKDRCLNSELEKLIGIIKDNQR